MNSYIKLEKSLTKHYPITKVSWTFICIADKLSRKLNDLCFCDALMNIWVFYNCIAYIHSRWFCFSSFRNINLECKGYLEKWPDFLTLCAIRSGLLRALRYRVQKIGHQIQKVVIKVQQLSPFVSRQHHDEKSASSTTNLDFRVKTAWYFLYLGFSSKRDV